MIPAAGIGTRLKPLTNNKPKALVEVQGAPMLQHAIKYLIRFGIKDIIINVHHFAEQIIEFLEKNQHFGINIQISDETDLLLDTGGAIKKAAHFFNNEPFLVYNVDIFTDINIGELINCHENSDALITMAVKERSTTRPILFDENLNLCEWRNVVTGEKKSCRKPTGELKPFGFSCVQVINPEIFDLIDKEGPFPIIPFYLDIAAKHNIKAYVHNESTWLEVGRFENIAEINAKKLDFLNVS
jgi:N-acetyl-alpha-D-muramate 1-phosphate uridylyltransferase